MDDRKATTLWIAMFVIVLGLIGLVLLGAARRSAESVVVVAPADGEFACELAESEDGFTLSCRPLGAAGATETPTADPYPAP